MLGEDAQHDAVPDTGCTAHQHTACMLHHRTTLH
jgi:hypothetical protein